MQISGNRLDRLIEQPVELIHRPLTIGTFMADDDLVELRGMSPRSVIGYIDAFAIAKRQNRMQVINRILLNWAREQAHVQSVISNTTRGNPALPDTGWDSME